MWTAATGSGDSLLANFAAIRFASGKVPRLAFFPFPKWKEMPDRSLCRHVLLAAPYRGNWGSLKGSETQQSVLIALPPLRQRVSSPKAWSMAGALQLTDGRDSPGAPQVME